ncbi:MAG: stressosome-associated protein Prli42 [Ignavibacteriales bacterium]
MQKRTQRIVVYVIVGLVILSFLMTIVIPFWV